MGGSAAFSEAQGPCIFLSFFSISVVSVFSVVQTHFSDFRPGDGVAAFGVGAGRRGTVRREVGDVRAEAEIRGHHLVCHTLA
jgi:hypothetical protein